MRFFYFILLFFSTNLLVAQQNFNVRLMNVDAGLPSDVIYQITEDTDGYIWMGTDNGVVKYNGSKFVVFKNIDGLPSNDIFGIKTDSQNRKWLTGYYNGLYYIRDNKVNFVKNTEGIVNINFLFERKDTLFFNKLHTGDFYFMTPKKGIEKYSKPLLFEVKHIKFRKGQKKHILNKKYDTVKEIDINDNSNLLKKMRSTSIKFSKIIQILEDSYNDLWIIDGENQLLNIKNYKSDFLKISSNDFFKNKGIFFKKAFLKDNSIYFITNTNLFYSYNIT